MKVKNVIIPGAAGKPISTDICFVESAEKKPVLLYAHGFNGFKDWGGFNLIAEELCEAGFVVVKFNFSHNGTTPEYPEEFVDLDAFGNNNYTRQLEDFKIIADWVCDAQNQYKTLFDTEKLYAIGHSLGGGLSILFASEDSRIKKLVTWASISECKTPWSNWPEEKMKVWLLQGVQYYTNTRTYQKLPLYYQLYLDYKDNEERLNIEKAIKKLSIPILLCHGNNDISVPVDKAYQLKEWQSAAELFIVESNHVFDRTHPWEKPYMPEAMDQVLKKTISFLK